MSIIAIFWARWTSPLSVGCDQPGAEQNCGKNIGFDHAALRKENSHFRKVTAADDEGEVQRFMAAGTLRGDEWRFVHFGDVRPPRRARTAAVERSRSIREQPLAFWRGTADGERLGAARDQKV